MRISLNATACWLLILLSWTLTIFAKRRDNVYEPLRGANCFRRLNGTHQTGCSSKYSGSVGALHYVQSVKDINFLVENPIAPPYTAIIPPYMFNRENVLRLKSAGPKNISGIILIDNTENMTQFSHELSCPNQYSGIRLINSTETSTCNAKSAVDSWNPWGTGLLHEDFPFPIYFINDATEMNKLMNCYDRYNSFDLSSHYNRRLCAVEINAVMSAAVNSEVCLRRSNYVSYIGRAKYCDPLEGRNIYSTLFQRNQSDRFVENRTVNPKERIILITCRLDSTSMFDNIGLGAMDSLVGFTTLINVGHMLARLLPDSKSVKDSLNVLFMVFNGESYDYIGSQRMVYDLENLEFPPLVAGTEPLNLASIEFMLDIGNLDDLTSIKMHTVKEFPQSKSIFAKLQKYATLGKYNFKVQMEKAVGIHLPPTSAQSFLRKNISFPAIILNSKPSNKYYHSIYDNAINLNYTYHNTTENFYPLMEATDAIKYFTLSDIQMKIRNVASMIAMTMYETLTGVEYNGTQLVNPILVDEFLYCFLKSAKCPLFNASSQPGSLPAFDIPPPRYISVAGARQEAPGWTYRVMSYILSQPVYNVNKENCSIPPLRWINGFDGSGQCRYTTQNFSYAVSPAFLIEDYDWKSGEYSTWTESSWAQFSARIFLRPSRVHETVILTIGIVIFVISFCIVYLINSRAEILFDFSSTTTSTNIVSESVAA